MKQLALLDYCLPDYFSGYHLPVIAIPVYGNMSHKDVADEIQSEANYIWDYLIDNGSEERWNELITLYCDELRKNKDAIFVEQDELSEEEEPSYLYFSITNPVYKYGMWFTNP